MDRSSLRVRLAVILFSVIVVPFLLVGGIFWGLLSRIERDSVVRAFSVAESFLVQKLGDVAASASVENSRVRAEISSWADASALESDMSVQRFERSLSLGALDGAVLLRSNGVVVASRFKDPALRQVGTRAAVAALSGLTETRSSLFSGEHLFHIDYMPVAAASSGSPSGLLLAAVVEIRPDVLDQIREATSIDVSILQNGKRKLSSKFDGAGKRRLADRVRLGSCSHDSPQGVYDGRRSFQLCRDLDDEQKIPGTLLLESSAEKLQVPGGIFLAGYLIFGVLVVTLAAVSLLLIIRLTVHPVNRLCDALRRFSEAPEAIRSVWLHAPGELGELASSIDGVIAQLHDAMSSMRQLHSVEQAMSNCIEMQALLDLGAVELRRILGAAEVRIFWKTPREDLYECTAVASFLTESCKVPYTVSGDVAARISAMCSTKAPVWEEFEFDFWRPLFGLSEDRERKAHIGLLLPLVTTERERGVAAFLWTERGLFRKSDIPLAESMLSGLMLQLRSIELFKDAAEKSSQELQLRHELIVSKLENERSRLHQMGEVAIHLGDRLNNPLQVIKTSLEELEDVAEAVETVNSENAKAKLAADLRDLLVQIGKAVDGMVAELALLRQYRRYASSNEGLGTLDSIATESSSEKK